MIAWRILGHWRAAIEVWSRIPALDLAPHGLTPSPAPAVNFAFVNRIYMKSRSALYAWLFLVNFCFFFSPDICDGKEEGLTPFLEPRSKFFSYRRWNSDYASIIINLLTVSPFGSGFLCCNLVVVYRNCTLKQLKDLTREKKSQPFRNCTLKKLKE